MSEMKTQTKQAAPSAGASLPKRPSVAQLTAFVAANHMKHPTAMQKLR
jgi:hypothetical protein